MVCITGRATNFGGGQDEIRRATFFGVFGEKTWTGDKKHFGGRATRNIASPFIRCNSKNRMLADFQIILGAKFNFIIFSSAQCVHL
mgnify:CR=1 FL=1